MLTKLNTPFLQTILIHGNFGYRWPRSWAHLTKHNTRDVYSTAGWTANRCLGIDTRNGQFYVYLNQNGMDVEMGTQWTLSIRVNNNLMDEYNLELVFTYRARSPDAK